MCSYRDYTVIQVLINSPATIIDLSIVEQLISIGWLVEIWYSGQFELQSQRMYKWNKSSIDIDERFGKEKKDWLSHVRHREAHKHYPHVLT